MIGEAYFLRVDKTMSRKRIERLGFSISLSLKFGKSVLIACDWMNELRKRQFSN